MESNIDTRRVLLVGQRDEEDLRGIASALKLYHYEVELRNDSVAALAELQGGESPFDVLVCDSLMPGMDGFELIASLRKSGIPSLQSLPVVVVLVGSTDKDEVDWYRVHGVKYCEDNYALVVLTRLQYGDRRVSEAHHAAIVQAVQHYLSR